MWDAEPIATRAIARAEGRRPQPSPFLSDYQAQIDAHVGETDQAARVVQPRRVPRVTVPRILAIAAVLLALPVLYVWLAVGR